MWREAKEESKSKRRKAFSVLKLSKQRRMELSENYSTVKKRLLKNLITINKLFDK